MLKAFEGRFLLLVLLLPFWSNAQENIITADVDHFWEAYDKIQTTQDSSLQMEYLETYFLQRGTPGLEAIREARNYKATEYLEAINKYPKYWESIRPQTLKAKEYALEIQEGVDAFREIYPEMKEAAVYFEIGVFRTGGTTLDGMVLIGAEMSMGNENTDVSELPESMNYVKNYLAGNPVNDIAFLNVHEFVHTQQNAAWAYDLLSQSVFEGSAEFIAELAMKRASKQPALIYGKANDQLVRDRFIEEMFSPWIYNWIWNNTDNPFNQRDLGYYMGYAIVKAYYDMATDKQAAVKTIIELDYTSREAVEGFVESSGYFDKPLSIYKQQFEKKRPRVAEITGLGEVVNPATGTFQVRFSEPMDTRFFSTNYGPSGESHFPEIEKVEFSENGREATYYLSLEAGREYELIIGSGYRNLRAIPLIPYPLQFKTLNE
ncbi:MAG: hypothetical protein GYB31_07150 [Bacteroidetes bacterium]|nr:hypothetical protein [Bacteroidota bacterium]